MHRYELLAKKGEGTFSEVIRARCLSSNKEVAIKVMRNKFTSLEQVNSLREIQALRRLSPDPGIVQLDEVLFDETSGRLALVFELMHMNLYELIRGRKNFLPEAHTKSILFQVLKAVDRMHRNSIFHRDLKPENILVSPGAGEYEARNKTKSGLVVKVADFGSCRGIYSKQPYTEYIATRWYRAPECLLTSGYYSFRMDLWAIGCIAFEIMALFPLFPGTNELNQIERIHGVLGTPSDEVLSKFKRFATHLEFNFTGRAGTGIAQMIPHVNSTCVDLIEKLLAYDPEERISARQALKHPYFKDLRQEEKRNAKAQNEPKPAESENANHPQAMKLPDVPGLVGKPAGPSPELVDENKTMVLPKVRVRSLEGGNNVKVQKQSKSCIPGPSLIEKPHQKRNRGELRQEEMEAKSNQELSPVKLRHKRGLNLKQHNLQVKRTYGVSNRLNLVRNHKGKRKGGIRSKKLPHINRNLHQHNLYGHFPKSVAYNGYKSSYESPYSQKVLNRR